MAFYALKHNICCFRKSLFGYCHAVSPDRKLAFAGDELGIDLLVLGETPGLNWPMPMRKSPKNNSSIQIL
jgi:hypothetical protein